LMKERSSSTSPLSQAEPRLEDLRSRVAGLLGEIVTDLSRLPGGASGLTYLAHIGRSNRLKVVVKVAPTGLPAVGNRDVLRQASILRVLHDVPGVSVPKVIAEDPGESLDCPPIFVMSHVEGDSTEPLQEDDWSISPRDMSERAHSAMRMLAAMHNWSAASAMLEEPPITLESEIVRWERAFGTVSAAQREGADACREALLASIPASVHPVIVHGDWRLGNMICEGPLIRAVIDWEIWSVGDPRGDLAWVLMAMDPEHPRSVVAENDLPGPKELLATYEFETQPVMDLAWFSALQRYKQAAIVALLVKNSLKLDQDHPFATTYGPVVQQLLRWCADILDL
jgi:aminoglycoside phosphotransferase (APT) family kinase protein